KFVYHDCGSGMLGLKRWTGATQLYYLRWQKSAWEVIERLHQTNPFDLMQHVTFAAYRYPTAIWNHGAPAIWGPLGGIESIPTGLLPWGHPVSLLREGSRNLANVAQSSRLSALPRRARATTLLLSSTTEMQRAFGRLGFASKLMPTIGLNRTELAQSSRAES